MPLAFLGCWLVSKMDASLSAQAEQGRFETQYVRSMTGLGAEGASSRH
jgi:cation/acetate symporter